MWNLATGSAFDGLGIVASGTGGAFYHQNNDLERGFRELGKAPETMYALGFTPVDAGDGHFHKLSVRLAGRAAEKGYSVPARLPFQDRPTQRLTIVTVLFDSAGNVVAGKRSELELSLKDPTFEQLSKTGFMAAMTIPAGAPGTYAVRAVALDALDGKAASASETVVVK